MTTAAANEEPQQAKSYWFQILNGKLRQSLTEELHAVTVNVSTSVDLWCFCGKNATELSWLLQVTLGIVLRTYTAETRVVFEKADATARGTTNVKIGHLESMSDISVRQILQNTTSGPISGNGLDGESNTVILQQPVPRLARQEKERSYLGGESEEASAHIENSSSTDPRLDTESDNGPVDILIDYSVSILHERQAAHLADTFQHALSVVVQQPSKPLKELDLCSPRDIAQLATWNRQLPEPSFSPIHQVIGEISRRYPNSIAVDAWDGNLTYQELDQLSSSLAVHLRSFGVGPDTFVPLCFEKSKWAVVALLGVLKAGGAYLFLDPLFPVVRMRGICQDTSASLLVASTKNALLGEKLVSRVLSIPDADLLCSTSRQQPYIATKVQPQNPLYAVFTSGSTGKPKGVAMGHGAFYAAAMATAPALHYSHTSRVLQFSNYTYDVSNRDILLTLLYGGCICMPSDSERYDNLAAFIGRYHVNWASLTPSTVDILEPDQVPGLRYLVLGGEPMSSYYPAVWADKVTLMNAYGPCECAAISSLHSVTRSNSDHTNIGRGVSSVLWIVDTEDHNKLAPIGATGELVIEGANVGLGYINQRLMGDSPFLHTTRWLHQFRQKSHARLYKTGDLARYNPDGTIAFIGRKDTQVKIRGQRVELAEVEHHVRRGLAEGGLSARVVAELITPTGSSNPMLVAFISGRQNEDESTGDIGATLTEIVGRLEGRLTELVPTYMIPAAYVLLDQFPMTATGKMDRRQLREMGGSMTVGQLAALNPLNSERRPPKTAVEQLLQELWAAVLNIGSSSISADDSFLRVGGDSIQAMRLVGAAREQGLLLTVADVFKHPRLCNLAKLVKLDNSHVDMMIEPYSLLKPGLSVDGARARAATLCGVDLERIEDIFPCTPLQEGLMAMTAKRAGDYVGRTAFEMDENIDMDRLRMAWQEVVAAAASILRTRIVDLAEQGLVQVVVDEPLRWVTDHNDLRRYIEHDQEQRMELGRPLSWIGVVADCLRGKCFLVWTVHHALYDGWSMPLVLEEVERVYQGAPQQRHIPFQSFVQHIVEMSEDQALSFWQAQFTGCEAVAFPELPQMYQPRADQVVQHRVADLRWPCGDITASTIVRAAWSLLVARHTDSYDVVFGATVTGRQAAVPWVERMLGPTIVTVPVRVKLDGKMVVGDLLRRIQSQALEMMAFEQLGLQQIRRINAEVERSSQFQTLLVVQPQDQDDSVSDRKRLFQSAGTEAGVASGLSAFNTYAMMVVCQLKASGVDLQISFDSNVLLPTYVRRIARQLDFVLRQLCAEANESAKIKEIETVSEQDLGDIWRWNATVPEAVEACVHELITERAQEQPAAPAIYAWDGELTYGELEALSTRLAHQLVELRVVPGQIVPLCFEKSMWTPVAMLGVMKAGGASVAMDTTMPEDRLRVIVGQTQASIILSSMRNEDLARRLADGTTLVVVEKHLKASTSLDGRVALPRVDPSCPIYVVFTSGSTGMPKGVVISHLNFSSAIKHQRATSGFEKTSRVYDFGSHAFDATWFNFLNTMSCGGCMCIPSGAARRNDIAGSLKAMGVTYTFLTPSVARLVDPSAVPSLATLTMGGEPVTQEDVNTWGSRVTLYNGYGPAECTPLSTRAMVDPQIEFVGSIGRGLGLVTWVVGSDGYQLAPVGAVGELWLEGPLVGHGYLNDAEKTAAAFIEDPPWLLRGGQIHPGRRGRLYRTGDLVRYDANGSLIFIGRKDSQVKIRGQRVELAEVEHHVRRGLAKGGMSVSVVAELITLVGSANPVLAAFVSIYRDGEGQGGEFSGQVNMKLAEIVGRLEERLTELVPAYMIPAAYIPVDKFPVMTTGKTDRRRLREMGGCMTVEQLAALSPSPGERRPPKTEAERQLQELWAAVLGIEASRIGADDSFLRIGGDSIQAMRLVGAARERGLSLTVADVFKQPRLCNLAELVKMEASASNAFKNIPKSQKSGPLEQSFAQERLWFLDQLHPGLTWYLMPCAIRLRGSLQLDALNAALLAVEGRHETLRTTFRSQDGVNVQDIHPFQMKELRVVDMSPYNEEDLAYALQQDQTTPFNLETEPGWRVSIYRCDKEDHVLSIVMHHIISDGWSVDVLRRELAVFYSAAIRGQDPLSQVEPLSIQYCDFSVWQRQQKQTDEYQRQLDYWATRLDTSRPAELLCDMPRPATLSGQADVQELRIGGVFYHELQQFCRAHNATPFIVFLAAFRATHYRLTGISDATVSAPNANRDRWEVKDMIGFFVNLQCIRISIEGESFEELVRQVRATMIASFANQDVPFEGIVAKLQKDRDLSRHPLVQIGFALHSQSDLGKFTFEGIETEPVAGSTTSRFDLEFHFYQEEHALQGRVLYSTDLYKSETIRNMLSVFHKVLERGLAEPQTAIASLPLLTDEDYSALDNMGLIQIHTTDYPRESSVVDIFRQQAAASPDRVAVKDSSTQLTYAELDQRSGAVARWLARRSFDAEKLIGVLANRSCHTIVAFLGILKANLAYLPLDVKIPTGRMETIFSWIQGHKLVLLGPGVEHPVLQLEDVEYIRISDMIDDSVQANGGFPGPAAGVSPSATSLAYVMFTSGTTGQPKGVMVEHRGIVRLVKESNHVQHLPAAATMAHIANIAFDASTFEIYATLLNGGTLICIESMAVLDYTALPRIFIQEQVQAMFVTPALLKQYLLQCSAALSMLHTLFVGGDRLEPQDIVSVQRLVKGKVMNAYGPTENTGASTIYSMPKREIYTNGVPIGRAVSNSGAYVMDPQQRLVPLGVVGELVVTGDGLARGYTDPQQDVDRFVSVVIGGEQVKAYRTGDQVRYRLADGQLEFFGRIDGQVKVRGHRIELGEIEQALRGHKRVDDAVAVLQHGEGQEAQVVGFVTIREGDAELDRRLDDGQESQLVKVWEEHFDAETYISFDSMRPETIGRDFIGWTSMYDGSEIDKGEMDEWLDDTIKTMLDGSPPGHVLEIGTGSGMILFNLTEGLESYVGLELSEGAVDFITKTTKSIPALTDKVKMYKATAADVGRLDAPVSPDLVVLNSVVQYFPSQDYLFRVVQDLLRLDGVKTLFFGDIRSYALHRDFLAARALHIAGENVGKDEIRRMMADLERAESELLLDPAFFTSLPSRLPDQIEHIEILPKKMHATNELSCYRYAAVVHVKAQGRQQQKQIHDVGQDEWIDFVEQYLDRQSLSQLLQNPPASSVVAVSNIPHAKTVFERHIVDSLDNPGDKTENAGNWLSSVRQRVQNCPSLSAAGLIELGEEAGYLVEVSWARQRSQHGGLDAIFHRCQQTRGDDRVLFRFPADYHGRPDLLLSSRPLRHLMKTRVQKDLHEKLRDKLPPYMVPQAVTVLDKMPVNENGKVDRRALTKSVQVQRAGRGPVRQPTSEVEGCMQQIWSQVLNIEAPNIGLDDSFFHLGGDSIAAMKVVGEARKAGIKLAVADIFRYPTTSIRTLTRIISDLQAAPLRKPVGGLLGHSSASVDLIAKINRHDSSIAAAQRNVLESTNASSLAADSELGPRANKLLTILLTGANGFIGTQILRQLLEHRQTGLVIAIVRSKTANVAKSRIIDSARKALWWTDFHEEKLRVWPGDLSLPNMGLDPTHWTILADGQTVDVIIHNGAVVHWGKGYAALEATNVSSTVGLLRLAVAAPYVRFVYVTGGRMKVTQDEQEEDVVRELAATDANGYSQTKFVAEAVVKRAALRCISRPNHLAIVSPGCVIGTPTEGVPNADDYIWRLVSACIRAGSYNADEADVWLPVSDAATTARIIINTALSLATGPGVMTRVRDGMTWGEFWAILQGMGYRLQARRAVEWLAAVREDIEVCRETHPLWPVAHMFEIEGQVTKEKTDSWLEIGNTPLTLKIAVRRSAEFLGSIGFLPPPPAVSDDANQAGVREAFSRSLDGLRPVRHHLYIQP